MEGTMEATGGGPMKKPDITPAQIVAIVGSILTVAISFGLNLSTKQVEALLNLVQVIAPVLLASDAVIRYGRSKHGK